LSHGAESATEEDNRISSTKNVQQFASGGYFGGGFRMVGERGAEVELTGPSRIFSNKDSSDMIADAVVQAIGGKNGGDSGGPMTIIVKIGERELREIIVETVPGAIRTDANIQNEIKRIPRR
jgi:hypothetical protein